MTTSRLLVLCSEGLTRKFFHQEGSKSKERGGPGSLILRRKTGQTSTFTGWGEIASKGGGGEDGEERWGGINGRE